MIFYSMPTAVVSSVSFSQITGSPTSNPALVDAMSWDSIMSREGITPISGEKTVGLGSDTPGVVTLEKGIVTGIQESKP